MLLLNCLECEFNRWLIFSYCTFNETWLQACHAVGSIARHVWALRYFSHQPCLRRVTVREITSEGGNHTCSVRRLGGFYNLASQARRHNINTIRTTQHTGADIFTAPVLRVIHSFITSTSWFSSKFDASVATGGWKRADARGENAKRWILLRFSDWAFQHPRDIFRCSQVQTIRELIPIHWGSGSLSNRALYWLCCFWNIIFFKLWQRICSFSTVHFLRL